MKEERKGLIAAGNWILDLTKVIDSYPEEETLSNILSQSVNNGGASYNVLKDLARLKAPFPLYGMGLTGKDDAGNYIMEDCIKHGINIDNLQQIEGLNTSFTDVMLVKNTGRRTFFHHRGANAFMDIDHIKTANIKARIFHLGYLLLLDKLDEFADEKRTRASLLLEKVSNDGLITSVDLVSEHSNRFQNVIKPSLPYIDILFLNEYEAEKLTGMGLGNQRFFKRSVFEKIIEWILGNGVRKWVILHFPAGAVAGSKNHEFLYQGSLRMPDEKIIGTTGAGDAFAAGVLFGIHEKWPMTKCLELGVCSAASCLTDASCSNGITDWRSCLKIRNQYSVQKLIDEK